MKRLVVDTNILIASLSSRSPFHWFMQLILQEKVEIFVTTEIVMEYEEKLKEKYSLTLANNFLAFLQYGVNVHPVTVYYHWRLLKDSDDDKFVNCCLASNAECLLSEDSDYNILKQINFPKINIVRLQEFKDAYIANYGTDGIV
jgi:putative PIN family toxin of toxin-antitoxin system